MIRLPALAALLLASATVAAAPRFGLPAGLGAADAAATQELVAAAQARLPPSWAQALDRPVALEWRDDLPEGVHGRARQWRILLRRELLDDWKQRQGTAAPEAEAPALAALLHELAHLYDRTASGGMSRDPRLLDLAGWQKSAVRPGRRARNDFRDRSPDPYELASPREYVAVNLEHYLLDPDYACRRPALAAYFDARFGTAPARPPACAEGLAFVQDPAAGAEPLRLLDPRRVYAVDYLLAGDGAGMASRWGHAMLRLVVCAPGREPGPDCRLDLQHHLVLSFRAFVDDLQISSWSGLTGRYPSRLFALPLGQVVDEYTRVELRDLHAIPLALSPEEVAAVATRAAQLHWSYDGRYLFASNNCAVETWKLLHDAVPRLAALPLRSLFPNGLARRLRRHGVVDAAAVPVDAAERVRLGFHFEAASTHYESMYAVARAALGLQAGSARDWIALPPARRRPALEQAGLKAAAALLVLESAALRREEALARDALKRRWMGRIAAADSGVAGDVQLFLEVGDAFSRPAAWLEGVEGYGLPQWAERERLEATAVASAEGRRSHARELEARIRALLPAARREALDGTESNLALLGERLRRLAREEGGLQAAQ
jgi:hypothetical protein